MKFSAVIVYLSCLIALVFGQTTTTPAPLNAGVAITNPVLNSTAYAGSNYTITWTVLDPNATTIEAISLMNGNAAALTLVFPNLLTNGSIPVSDLQYNWTIPANLTTREDYVLTMRGNNSYVTYSSYFSIVNNNATSTNATAQQ
ncbi:hypothetical protein V8B55DRAFT_1518716 [Mucor lusitanicus]|uniref:Yeast cell wall synthesis Kre9/Knh1-like N-terminal domain-containing protein n=2 Tax=Mucor circinelloides f. lusitanicus TaxID=29924 RepID=A0A168L9D3_MUCCL|nr:hypothetical protein FB192DRAFT_1395432 [Mucor lusitanicus]OAD03257.1 hypothetical protein MUCCIDRAFT_156094 [Mucor lusitanicus CBS 277.49]